METKKEFVQTKQGNFCLGITETLGFNRNFSRDNEKPIEIINKRVNPKNKRVVFFHIKHENDLKNLIDSFTHLPIEQCHIEHNEFAAYKYQIIEK
jgi:hypothetical protein